jgi:hypothetical protein
VNFGGEAKVLHDVDKPRVVDVVEESSDGEEEDPTFKVSPVSEGDIVHEGEATQLRYVQVKHI